MWVTVFDFFLPRKHWNLKVFFGLHKWHNSKLLLILSNLEEVHIFKQYIIQQLDNTSYSIVTRKIRELLQEFVFSYVTEKFLADRMRPVS